jgi:hypothetical protein
MRQNETNQDSNIWVFIAWIQIAVLVLMALNTI